MRGALGPYGAGKCDDKPFMHKHNKTYYLSWGACVDDAGGGGGGDDDV